MSNVQGFECVCKFIYFSVPIKQVCLIIPVFLRHFYFIYEQFLKLLNVNYLFTYYVNLKHDKDKR